MAARRERDDERKLYLYMDVVLETNIPGFVVFRSRTATELGNELHWTPTRTQATIDRMIAAGRMKKIGLQLNLGNPGQDRPTYCVADKEPALV